MNHTTLQTSHKASSDMAKLGMTRKLKNYIHIFMVIGFMSQNIQIQGNHEVGSTKLIEFVQQREKDLIALNEIVKTLTVVCVPKKTIKKIFGADRDTIETTYWIANDRPELLDALYESRKLLKNFEEDTKKQIAEIMKDNVSIHMIDKQGKTALSYCKSRDVYNALRSQGASFQIDSFSDINQSQLLGTGLVAAAWAAFLAVTLMPITPADNCHARHAAINNRDEKGRTPLMNYIIKQETEIDPYRVGYTLSPSFLSKITDAITKMVEQGADVTIQDFQGKTVLDYCKTKAIYQHLRSLGAPLSFNAWLSGNKDAVIGLSLVSAIALIAAIDSTTNRRGQDKVGMIFDRYFEKNYRSE